jgi:sec-independent protein translocase protein TatA
MYTRQRSTALRIHPLNGDNMFDPSPLHILVLLIVVVLLFGSRRLPGAAKSLGESMHIYKKSVAGLSEEGKQDTTATTVTTAAAQPQAAPPAALPPVAPAFDGASQQQIADLQRQVADLQKQNAAAASGAADSSQQTF